MAAHGAAVAQSRWAKRRPGRAPRAEVPQRLRRPERSRPLGATRHSVQAVGARAARNEAGAAGRVPRLGADERLRLSAYRYGPRAGEEADRILQLLRRRAGAAAQLLRQRRPAESHEATSHAA